MVLEIIGALAVIMILAAIYEWTGEQQAKKRLSKFASIDEIPPSEHDRREAIREWDAKDQFGPPLDPPSL